jgi:hypothetical protein
VFTLDMQHGMGCGPRPLRNILNLTLLLLLPAAGYAESY